MPDDRDLATYVRGPLQEKPFVAIWALPPNTAGVVGGIPDMIRTRKEAPPLYGNGNDPRDDSGKCPSHGGDGGRLKETPFLVSGKDLFGQAPM